MRPAHVLKDNKTIKIPSKFLFFDTETYQDKVSDSLIQQRFRLVTCIYWKRATQSKREQIEYKYFYDPDEFFNYAISKISKKEKLIMISHNIHFDLSILNGYEWICKNKWKVKSFIDNSNVYVMNIEKEGKRIEFINSFNFFKSSIKELGKMIGLEKLEVDFNNVTNENLIKYSFRDCEILLKLFQFYIQYIIDNNIGTFQKTISSQSFTAFRHRFMNYDIFIHNDKTAIKLERKSYFGGRNECFYIGTIKNENIYQLDVNSMYPYVMRENKFPTKLIKKESNIDIKKLDEYLKKYCLIGVFKLSVKEPVFPYVLNDRTCFPIGEGIFFLSTPEIKYAYENEYIKRIFKLLIYEEAPIFQDFVEFFYNERLKCKNNNDVVFSNLHKLILNSLYGKFGQRGNEWQLVEFAEDFKFKYIESLKSINNKRFAWRQIGNRIEQRVERGESYNSFVAIASHVTAYARIYLWSLIKKAGLENVYYVDTDSLFTNQVGYMNLREFINPNKLGFLKLEGVEDYFEIRGLKDYTFGMITKIKGVKLNEDNVMSDDFIQLRFPQFRMSLRKGWINQYFTEVYTKHLKREYNKGIVTNSGKIKPYTIGFNPFEFFINLINKTT